MSGELASRLLSVAATTFFEDAESAAVKPQTIDSYQKTPSAERHRFLRSIWTTSCLHARRRIEAQILSLSRIHLLKNLSAGCTCSS